MSKVLSVDASLTIVIAISSLEYEPTWLLLWSSDLTKRPIVFSALYAAITTLSNKNVSRLFVGLNLKCK